jgi:hypothetical protein
MIGAFPVVACFALGHWAIDTASVCTSTVLVAAVPSNSDIRTAVETVFARPEFSPQTNPFRWVRELLARYFRWLGELSTANPVLFWVLLIGCVTLLTLLMIHIGWTVHRVFGTRAALSSAEAASRQRQRLSMRYWEEALRNAEQSDYAEAIRCLFLSLVYRFDESGRVNFLRTYTNREYLSLFADRPDAHAALGVFVDTIDDCWYGQRPTDRARYQQCLAYYEGLK